nr:MAG TPA: hypothetical protein [Caudoviricetes sp.]
MRKNYYDKFSFFILYLSTNSKLCCKGSYFRGI